MGCQVPINHILEIGHIGSLASITLQYLSAMVAKWVLGRTGRVGLDQPVVVYKNTGLLAHITKHKGHCRTLFTCKVLPCALDLLIDVFNWTAARQRNFLGIGLLEKTSGMLLETMYGTVDCRLLILRHENKNREVILAKNNVGTLVILHHLVSSIFGIMVVLLKIQYLGGTP